MLCRFGVISVAKKTQDKTNVMRILEQKKIAYISHTYPHDNGPVDGVTVAGIIGRAPECVFKTLVTRGTSNQLYVFVIPVLSELDLKKAAKAVGALIAKKAAEKGITEVVFDRGGYVYHGRVQELAEAARVGGLKF